MKYIVNFCLFLFPTIIFASTADTINTLVQFEDNSGLFEALSLWSTIIIAFTTSAMVWIGGRQMRGGVFGKVLLYFSIGMTLVLLGFLTEIPNVEQISHLYLKLVHDSLYIVGYILMGLGANALLKVIKG